MKRIFLLLLIFFAAVALAPMLIDEKGYILIKIGDHARETTVTAAVTMILFLFFILLFFTKLLKGGLSLSLGAWHKIAFASRRRALKDLNKGIAAYILEDYQQAEHLLAKCAEPSQFEEIAYLLAASAAEKQALPANTKHYLAQLSDNQDMLKEVGLEAILVTIKLLISREEYQQARTLIDNHHKHIGHDPRLLALEIELSLQEQRFDYVVEQLVSARKNKYFSTEKIATWEAKAFYGAFSVQITLHDSNTLHQFWDKLGRKLKQREAIVFAYCRVLAKNNINQPLAKILLPVVKKGANEALLKDMRTLTLSSPDDLISAVQKHLHHDQLSAKWLSCLAHLAIAGEQWSMAEKAFNSLVNLEGEQYDKVDLLAFAKVLKQQEQLDKAIQVMERVVEA